MSTFGTFWSGPRLSAFEASCLKSFVTRGHELTLFSYQPVDNVPQGIRIADARLVTSENRLSAFKVDGVSSISHFSDYFRYVMFSKTDLIWVDTDIMLLSDFKVDSNCNLLALESRSSVCNAVLRIAREEAWLPQIISRCEAAMNTSMRWGETGPKLLTHMVRTQGLLSQARPHQLFFPIHFDDFWKVFLPENRDECQHLCQHAHTLHLWNNIVDRLGFWKEFLPPEGSYLHELFVTSDCQSYFRGVFPLKNMRQLVANWVSRQTGEHLGIGGVARQVLPSLLRTYKHYIGSGDA